MSSSSVLVTGATGKQGGAVIKALLTAKHAGSIFALTRNANSAAAKALPEAVTVVEGDLDAPEAVFEKLAGKQVDVVFSIQQPWGGQEAKEVTQGKGLFNSAVKHGVKHFVYSSVNRHGEGPTAIPHFASKAEVEQHIKANAAGKIDWTILRPTCFMENWPAPGDPAGAFLGACLEVGLAPTTKLQFISVADIGKLAALAIHDRTRFAGKAINLVGDDLTWPEIQQTFREAAGIEAPTIPGFRLANAGHEMETMIKWFEAVGYDASLDESRKLFQPEDLASYLRRTHAKAT